jgi:photosystem II stability/assembly factor-like uncharacterized protein
MGQEDKEFPPPGTQQKGCKGPIVEAESQEPAEIGDIVYSIAVSPNFCHDGVCFAARCSGLYQSQDGGITWRSAYEALNLRAPLPTMAVAVSPDFVEDQSVFAGVLGGVLRSSDGGASWSIAELPSPPPLVSALVVSPDFVHDGTLLAATMEDGVFRSADRGSRWAAWNFGLLDLRVLTLAISPAFTQDETLFAGTESGLFRSTNGGRAWREVDFPTAVAPVLSLALSPAYAADGVLFAGTEGSGGPGYLSGLFHSSDRGRTWVCLDDEATAGAVNSILLSPDFPAQADVLAVFDSLLMVSRDGGQTWSPWKPDLSFDQGVSCAVAPQGLDPGAPVLVGLVDGGVLRL